MERYQPQILQCIYRQFGILDGAATCFEGFVKSFIKVPLACLGSMHGSCSISLQPGELSEKSEQNLWNKWPPHPEYMGELLEGWRALQPSWAVLNKCMKVHLNICNSTITKIGPSQSDVMTHARPQKCRIIQKTLQ